MSGQKVVRTIGCGAGFAGDRIEPAVALASSGQVDTVVLECLAERTLVPGLRARRADQQAGADPRLRRRLTPLLPAARANKCRIVSNLGAANPAAAAHQIAALAAELGLRGLSVAGVLGDDVLALRDQIAWHAPVEGDLLGAHAYLGTAGLIEAIDAGADVVVTGRVADSALFAADLAPHIDATADAFAGAIGGRPSAGMHGPDHRRQFRGAGRRHAERRGLRATRLSAGAGSRRRQRRDRICSTACLGGSMN